MSEPTNDLPRHPAIDDIPAEHRLPANCEQREYLVDGELRTWEGPLTTVHSPLRCGGDGPHAIGAFPAMDRATAEQALAAARRAWADGRGAWAEMPVAERIRAVEDFLHLMVAQRDEVVRLLMWEIGKPLPDARREFDRTAEYVRDTIDALKELDRASSRFTLQEGIIGQIRRAPLGVVLSMGPYNYPLNETFTTLIPALAMGNPVVFKPPKHGTLLHRPLLAAFAEAFPPGVVNTVYGAGREVVAPLMAGGGIDVLAFIGTSRVADELKRQHPKPHRLRAVLGLEAKNAAIVLADADLDLTVRECLAGALTFNGQRCTALKLLFVHDKVADRFLAGLCDRIAQLKAGMPWEDGVTLTPLPEPGKVRYLTELVDDAVAKGARVVNPGGGTHDATYFHPAVLYPVTSAMRVFHEEQFGPVVPVARFADVEQPVRAVVESNYGQQVSLFGQDPAVLAGLIDLMVNQVCRVNLNSQCQRGPDTFPFTGRKDSAEGTLSVSDALRVFSIRTLVAARDLPLNKAIISDIVRERRSGFLSTDFIL